MFITVTPLECVPLSAVNEAIIAMKNESLYVKIMRCKNLINRMTIRMQIQVREEECFE